MDPNKLSMEEGKHFLKQCGIPQRDIDLMTEKWVVVASVEVLIRFPQLPGEDPTVRCVSNKNSQPAVSQLNPIPQNNGNQGKRKYNEESMKGFAMKGNVTNQGTGDYIKPRFKRPTIENTEKKTCFIAVRKSIPEEETKPTQAKGKNSGAFGHMARRKVCPRKRRDEALPFLPLGSKKDKEKLKTEKAQQIQSPGVFKETEGEEKEQQMKEVIRRKILTEKYPRRSPKKGMRTLEVQEEFWYLLRKPTRQSISYLTKKKTSLYPA